MKFLFGLIGLVFGGLTGSVFAAVTGLVVGVVLATLLKKTDQSADASPHKSSSTPQPASGTKLVAPRPLEDRVAKLEEEVVALRAEIKRLNPSKATAAPAKLAEEPAGEWPTLAADMAAAVASTSVMPAMDKAAPLPELESAEAHAARSTLPDAVPDTGPDTVPVPMEEVLQAATTPGEVPPSGLPVDAKSTPPTPPTPPTPTAAPARRPAPVVAKAKTPSLLHRLIFGGNTIVKIGVLILFFGLAFLLRYAAERVTLPVEFRYAGVALLGAVLLGVGWRLRHRQDAAGGSGYGMILQGAGIGVFYLTTLAALKVSALLPTELAFAILFVVAVLSAVLAVAQNAPWLAYVAAAEGFAAPVLVSTGGGNHIALFSYLAILDVGIFLVAWFKAWRPLNLIGFVGTTALAGAWARSHYNEALYASTQAFLVFFFLLFTAIGVLIARRALAVDSSDSTDGKDDRQPLAQRAAQALADVGRVDSSLVFGVPLASFSLQYLLVRDWEFGPAWAAAAMALFYLLLGGSLLRGGNKRSGHKRNGHRRYSLLGEAYVIVSVIFGTLAIPLALEGEWTGATWAIEAAGMFWLGVRQSRLYTRVFASLVLAGAAVRMASALAIDPTPGTPPLAGSSLGMLMLALGALAMFRLSVRHRLADGTAWEGLAAALQLWIGVAAATAIAWIHLTLPWACVCTSFIGLACAFMQSRNGSFAWQWASAALHGVALCGFAMTLHALHGSAMLGNGWQGLVSAVLIGACLLGSAWLPLRAAVVRAREADVQPQWSLGSSIGLLAGVGLIAASLLFVMPVDQAARIWPWLGVLALWMGLRLAQPALALAWCLLQASAAFGSLIYGPFPWLSSYTEWTLWTPLSLAVAGLVSGDCLQSAAKKRHAAAWLQQGLVQWSVVVWSLLWWSQALPPDAWRHLLNARPPATALWPMVLTSWVLATSAAIALLARWRQWRVLGQAAWATLLAWMLTAAMGIGAAGDAPHEHMGWLVWPMALAWHVVLLRMLGAWCSRRAMAALHVGGFWFFVALAARQAQWLTQGWGDPGSAWSLLGWAVVPALALVAITRERVLQRWPLNEFRDAYLLVAGVPVALYLLLWLWVGNTQSGNASPLPYLPLLNPLELGQGVVMLALYLWYRCIASRGESSLAYPIPRPVLLAVLGATAFALYTGVVLRTCHHWAGVPWDGDTLFASKLAQAALSVAWSIVGVALMMVGHQRIQRMVWMVGAALLGVVVLKLFFVELADRGGVYRIVSFMVVGLLLLVVGYFAPVPPNRKELADAS